MALFLLNEWFHPLPFFKIQLLRNRNLSHSLLTLGGVLVVLLGVILIPSSFGAAARLPATGNRAGAAGHGPAPADRAAVGGRAVQPAPGRLPLGAGRRLPAGAVMRAGLAADAGRSREQFYALEAVQIFAQPMAVIPLLMLATGGLAPQDGPFASAGSTPSRVSPRWRPPACWTR